MHKQTYAVHTPKPEGCTCSSLPRLVGVAKINRYHWLVDSCYVSPRVVTVPLHLLAWPPLVAATAWLEGISATDQATHASISSHRPSVFPNSLSRLKGVNSWGSKEHSNRLAILQTTPVVTSKPRMSFTLRSFHQAGSRRLRLDHDSTRLEYNATQQAVFDTIICGCELS